MKMQKYKVDIFLFNSSPRKTFYFVFLPNHELAPRIVETVNAYSQAGLLS